MYRKLSVNIANLRLRNPTMLSAGILGLSGKSLRRVWESGAGAVVTKSLGIKPRMGNPNPTIVDLGYGFINAMGLPNPGVNFFTKEVELAKKGGNLTLIASIFGDSPTEFTKVAKIIENSGVDGIELNVSCPNVEKFGLEICQDHLLLHKIIKSVKSKVKIPVFTKLTPNTSDITSLAKIAEDAGTDGIVATNTLRAMAIDVETGIPILSNIIGGFSGPALKPIAIRCVYEIAKVVDIPIIGCGGVSNWKDAVEFLLAGASAVQIGTAIAHKDLKIFRDIVKGIYNYLKNKNLNVSEIIGTSHKY